MTPIPRACRRALAPAAALLLALSATPALAHEGNPHYRSVVREIVPPTDGLSAQVLEHDDALLVVNDSDRTVVVVGPDGQPYARLLGDGTVQVNSESSIVRGNLSDDDAAAKPRLYASVTLLAHGDEQHAPPDAGGAAHAPHAHDHPIAWSTLDRTGRLQWHDPRIKYRAQPVPPQVTDESQETKVKDWRVPLVVGGRPGAILGTLTWVGELGGGSSFPAAAVVSLAVLMLLAVGAVLLVRRNRRRVAGEEGAP
jgi:hypothetical protein